MRQYYTVKSEFGLDNVDPEILETDLELLEAIKEALRLSPTGCAVVETVSV